MVLEVNFFRNFEMFLLGFVVVAIFDIVHNIFQKRFSDAVSNIVTYSLHKAIKTILKI